MSHDGFEFRLRDFMDSHQDSFGDNHGPQFFIGTSFVLRLYRPFDVVGSWQQNQWHSDGVLDDIARLHSGESRGCLWFRQNRSQCKDSDHVLPDHSNWRLVSAGIESVYIGGDFCQHVTIKFITVNDTVLVKVR